MIAKVTPIPVNRGPSAAYQASKPSLQHKAPPRSGSADASVGAADARLRDWARWLDENLDIVTGALDKLCNFIVGTGITIEPMVRSRNGKLLDLVNNQIRTVLLSEDSPNSWSRSVNVTGEYTRGEQEWTACRTWLRDGEIIGRKVSRRESRTSVPHQVQLIECDHLPFELLRAPTIVDGRQTINSIVHGVEKDEWGRPVSYHLYRQSPGDIYMVGYGFTQAEMMQIPAREIEHLKFTRRRANQTRGVTSFHSTIFRLDDIADYEDAHRIGARIAAQLLGAIQRSPDSVDGDIDTDRKWEMENGQIFGDMLPGEQLQWYKPEAPNPDSTPFLDDQIRRASTGFGLGYSTFSGKYDKSFSAARQEQSENWYNIETLRGQFISDFVRPAEYEPALDAAIASGLVRIPREADPATIYAADYRGPPRPTIDDEKQARADQIVIETNTDSRLGRIRERGRSPVQVDAEIEKDDLHQVETKTDPDQGNPMETP